MATLAPQAPDLVDIGANLTNRAFAGDMTATLERARSSGVNRIVVTGTSVSCSTQAMQLATEYPEQLWSTAGVHPHHAKDFADCTRSELRTLAQDPKVVAIGECGLDFNRNYSPEADQQRAFEQQLELAVELRLPVFLHERDAFASFVAILKAHRDQLTRGVVHCFTGSTKALHAYLDLDMYIGVTGWICDERRGTDLRLQVRDIPANRLLVETDAPYLLPRDYKPAPAKRRNEPSLLPHVVQHIATCREHSVLVVASQSTANACEFFGI